MKKLIIKTTGFSGTSIFFDPRGDYIVSSETSLPEGFLFGVEVPDESGIYFSNTPVGAYVVKISASGIEVLPWSTHTGILGDYSYVGGTTLPRKPSHDMFVLTDSESDGAQYAGEPIYNYGLVGDFNDGNFEFAKSLVEIGDSLIVPQQPMSIDKDTGNINWMYLDSLDRPAFPWGLRNNRSVINEKYFIFLNRNTTIIVLDTETGNVIEEVPMSVIPDVVDTDEGSLFQLFSNNEFLYMGSDYVNSVGRAYILSVDETASPGSRLTVTPHPESGVLHEGKVVFWGWFENSFYNYWGIWNNCFYRDEDSYYLFYYNENSLSTGSLAKFNSSHQLEWVYDLYENLVFGAQYIFYQFAKAGNRIALLPCYSQISVPADIVVLDDATGIPVAVPSSENEKVHKYISEGEFFQVVYAKAAEGNKIPFIGNVTVDVEGVGEEAFVYGYFDTETLTWVEELDFDFPGASAFFGYPVDAITGVLQREADGSYFYFVELYTAPEGGFGFDEYDSQYLVRLNKDFNELTFERLNFGGRWSEAEKTNMNSIQTTLSSEGRVFGITNSNQIVSSVTDGRSRVNSGQQVILEKDKWYDFKSEDWNTGLRPIIGRTVNPMGIPLTNSLPATSKHIPLTRGSTVLNTETWELSDTSFPVLYTTIAPDQTTMVGVGTSNSGASAFLNSVTGVIENPNSYPFYSISATIRPYAYLFRQDNTPVVVRASSTQTIVMQHNGSNWVAGSTLNLTSASTQRYFLYNDTLYAFRAVNGGDFVISVYNWATPSWSTHVSAPVPVGGTLYYDTPADFAATNNIAYRDGTLYLSNGFEYNMGTGLFTEVPYPETFYNFHRVSGSNGTSRVTLQVVGDYMIMYYAGVGSVYTAIRPLEESLPPPF